MEEIKLSPEDWSVFLDYYEYDPRLYSLEQIDCAELTANNCLEQFREDMDEFIRQVNRKWGEKLRATDTDHIFNIICHGIWDMITQVQMYYFDECDKTRSKILEMMEEEYNNKESGTRQKENGDFPLEEFPDQVDDSIRFKDLSLEKICNKYCGSQGSAECACCPYGRRVHE